MVVNLMNSPRESGNVPPLVLLMVSLLYSYLFTGDSKIERIGPYRQIEFRRQPREVCWDMMPIEQTLSKDLPVAWIDDMKHHTHGVNDGVLE